MKDSSITLSTGDEINPLDPDPKDIDIENIARGLSKICRFTGQLKPEREFYSVAQHCVLATEWAAALDISAGRKLDKNVLKEYLAILLHDASEAYLNDISSPVKQQCRDYLLYENVLQTALFRRFVGPGAWSTVYKKYDGYVYWLEIQHIMPHSQPLYKWVKAVPDHVPPIARKIISETWMPNRAYSEFMVLFQELTSLIRD